MEFTSSITSLPTDFSFIKDLNIVFNNNIELHSSVTVQGLCSISSSNNNLNFMDGAAIIVDSNSTLELQAVVLNNIESNKILLVDDTSRLILNNSTIELAGNWTFSQGSVIVKNISSLRGSRPYVFAYTSNISSHIFDDSTLLLDGGLTFSFGRQTVGGIEPLILDDTGATLACAECTLYITKYGAELSKGTLLFNGNALLETESSTTTYGFFWGDNTLSANDLHITFGPGSQTMLNKGAFIYNNVGSDGMAASSPSSILRLTSAVTFHAVNTCRVPANEFRIDSDGISFPVVSMGPLAIIDFNETILNIPGYGNATYKGYFDPIHQAFAVNLTFNDYVYLSSGTPAGLLVQGQGNILEGTGNVINDIILRDQFSQIYIGIQGSITAPLRMNGGTITLASDVNIFSPSVLPTEGAGTIDLNSYTLTRKLPAGETVFDAQTTFSGNEATLNLIKDCTLTGTWNFEGNVTIEGNGNSIFFDGGSMIVAPNSVLTIKNIPLNNIIQNSIYCTDNTGIINLNNVIWNQSNDVEFSKGALNYSRFVLMTGLYSKFTYTSTCTMTVNFDSELSFDNLFTFSYAPSNSSTTLFALADFTSKLVFNHTVLYITPGLHLTKGQLTLQQAPKIYALGEGLTLGDETITDSSADVQITFLDTSLTSIQEGSLNYMNLKDSSLQMWTHGGLDFQPASSCKAYQTIDTDIAGGGTIIFEYQAQLYTKQSPGCTNISDVTGAGVINKPTPNNLCL